MIPAVVLGLLFHDTIKSLFNPINVMYALVVGGLLLIAAELDVTELIFPPAL